MASILVLCFFLLAMLSSTSRRVFAFRCNRNEFQTMRKLSYLVSSASSTNTGDLPAKDSPQQQQQQQHPRAAVSVAVRCFCGDPSDPKPHYLLIRRGNEPNKGKWALPGGKLEWGETTLHGARRELSEEVIFEESGNAPTTSFSGLAWGPEPYATADAIAEGFHYLIAVCFAEWKATNEGNNETDRSLPLSQPPRITAADDATDARWWSMDEIDQLEDDALLGTPGFVKRIKRTEFLYQTGVLTNAGPVYG
jgi:ADP-ribose pyrophosphatase YjhB (NUDIX family)